MPPLPEGEEDNAAEVLGIALKTVVAPVHRCYETYRKLEISGGSEDIGRSTFHPLHCLWQGKIVGYEANQGAAVSAGR